MSNKPDVRPTKVSYIGHCGQCGDILYCSENENDCSQFENGIITSDVTFPGTHCGYEHTHNGDIRDDGIPPYPSDAGDTYRYSTYAEKLDWIKRGLYDLRWHSGIEGYPYKGDLGELRTVVICLINSVEDLVHLLEREG